MKWYFWLLIAIVLVLIVWGGRKLYLQTDKTNAGTGVSASFMGNTVSAGIRKANQ